MDTIYPLVFIRFAQGSVAAHLLMFERIFVECSWLIPGML